MSYPRSEQKNLIKERRLKLKQKSGIINEKSAKMEKNWKVGKMVTKEGTSKAYNKRGICVSKSNHYWKKSEEGIRN